MFQNKSILLLGDKKSFNSAFIKKYHNSIKEIRLLTKDIFDEDYHDIPHSKIIGFHQDLSIAFKNIDYVYCFVSKDLENLVNSLKEDMIVFYKSIVDTAIKEKVKKLIFISDGSISVENDVIIKNLVTRKALFLNNNNNFDTSLVFSLCQSKNMDYLVDFAILITKISNSGDILVKKSLRRESFADKLKNIFNKNKELEENSMFFDADELSRVEDFWEYIKVPLDRDRLYSERKPFVERIKSFESIKIDEVEEV